MKAIGVMLGAIIMFVLGVFSGAFIIRAGEWIQENDNTKHTHKRPEKVNGFKECTVKGFCG